MYISNGTALRALDWLAYGYRQALNQYSVNYGSRNGIDPTELDKPGTWIEIDDNAVRELHAKLGGWKEGQYVLARRPGEKSLRRFRLTDVRETLAHATEAWSMANEKAEWTIELESAIYVG